MDLILALQIGVRETLQEGCFPPPSFVIGRSYAELKEANKYPRGGSSFGGMLALFIRAPKGYRRSVGRSLT